MNTSAHNLGHQRTWAAGLALLSLIVPIIIASNNLPTTLLTAPAQPSDERLTVVALVLGVTAAVGALLVNRGATPSWLRWLSISVATLGVLFCTYLLVALIGSCGMQVVWATCRP